MSGSEVQAHADVLLKPSHQTSTDGDEDAPHDGRSRSWLNEHRDAAFMLFVGVVGCAVFLNSLDGELIFDDVHAVVRNRCPAFRSNTKIANWISACWTICFWVERVTEYLRVCGRDVVGSESLWNAFSNDYWGEPIASNSYDTRSNRGGGFLGGRACFSPPCLCQN